MVEPHPQGQERDGSRPAARPVYPRPRVTARPPGAASGPRRRRDNVLRPRRRDHPPEHHRGHRGRETQVRDPRPGDRRHRRDAFRPQHRTSPRTRAAARPRTRAAARRRASGSWPKATRVQLVDEQSPPPGTPTPRQARARDTRGPQTQRANPEHQASVRPPRRRVQDARGNQENLRKTTWARWMK